MNINKRVLSTKLLNEPQSELLLATGLAMVHFNILNIKMLNPSMDHAVLHHIIITSSNAVEALKSIQNKDQQFYVVGEKTALEIRELGFSVKEVAQNAAQLAQNIIAKYSKHHFTYLCGVHRRDELPQALSTTQINFMEVKVYDSVVVEKSFDCIFDAVLFFSPRGVHAFAKANPQNLHLAICIGETTATAARIYTQNVKVAHKTTVENTIVTAVKALLND
ncbi:MAG: uroporphyrinogen-III synthase [Nonlabens sp.]|uniref:uroporphyrinogen-III synthase n=1 Tax=Nonlabens sp. TaxID=1888209 RepID=UPI003EF09FEB